ncbi:hypothetical protein HK096_002726 [Nowakowskiella sp. JEL0078]|nr:hypothetical protein HK096_002726 [Nowakowskiella sp. JEL0078]
MELDKLEISPTKRFVKKGDKVAQFDKLCEVQSDKAADNITSRFDGTVQKLHYKDGDMAQVGKPLVDIDISDDAQDNSNINSAAQEPKQNQDFQSTKQRLLTDSLTLDNGDDILTTPSVRRLAKENSVDLSKIKATGKNGRISKEDILSFISTSKISSQEQSSVDTKPKSTSNTKIETIQDNKIVPLTGLQRAMFKQMTKSLSIPHFGFSEEIYLDELTKTRNLLNTQLRSTLVTYGIKKLSYMPFFIKTLSMALKEFPILNAMLIEDTESGKPSLKYRVSHNIGFAMDTENGLLVPNIKNVQNLSVLDIAKEMDRIRQSGSTQNASDLNGGTITLSNVGNIGGTTLHPVLVTTEVCIGGIGRIQILPRFEVINGKSEIVSKEVVVVSFNADHRVIDGATMARFVQVWKSYLESPSLMLLELV